MKNISCIKCTTSCELLEISRCVWFNIVFQLQAVLGIQQVLKKCLLHWKNLYYVEQEKKRKCFCKLLGKKAYNETGFHVTLDPTPSCCQSHSSSLSQTSLYFPSPAVSYNRSIKTKCLLKLINSVTFSRQQSLIWHMWIGLKSVNLLKCKMCVCAYVIFSREQIHRFL